MSGIDLDRVTEWQNGKLAVPCFDLMNVWWQYDGRIKLVC